MKTAAQTATGLLLVLTVVGTLRMVLGENVWQRPGCHKVGAYSTKSGAVHL